MTLSRVLLLLLFAVFLQTAAVVLFFEHELHVSEPSADNISTHRAPMATHCDVTLLLVTRDGLVGALRMKRGVELLTVDTRVLNKIVSGMTGKYEKGEPSVQSQLLRLSATKNSTSCKPIHADVTLS